MSHPLRLRILRLCLHDALTNKELADRLGKDPATVLHHVRMLVETGFLVAERPRTGARGALEKPYRATGKSWDLSLEKRPPDERLAGQLASIDAFRAEVADAGPDAMIGGARIGLKLGADAAADLNRRIDELIADYAGHDDPDGDTYGLFIGFHRRP